MAGSLSAEKRHQAFNLDQRLRTAAKNGTIKEVETLIGAGAGVNQPDVEGYMALHRAAEAGHFDMVNALIDNDADTNARTNEGYTPLMLATKACEPLTVELLASRGSAAEEQVDATASGTALTRNPKDTASFALAAQAMHKRNEADLCELLQHAITHNDVPMAARIIVTAKIDLDKPDSQGHTLLALAADRGDEEMIRLLLCTGASVSAPDKNGKAPLMHAAANHHVAAIAVLLQAGAATTLTERTLADRDHESSLDLAISNDDTAVLSALLDRKGRVMPMHSGPSLVSMAARLGKTACARMLLARGADSPDEHGSLTLAMMAKNGELDAVKTLLQAGADPHHRAWDGHTAFTLAAANGHGSVVSEIIAHCPVPYSEKGWTQRLHEHADNQGRTALMLAVLNRKHETAELLLRHHGADLNKTDHQGRNAMLWAAAKGDPAMVDLLIGYHAKPAAVDRQGNTALLAAAENNNTEVVKLFFTPQFKAGMPGIDTANKDGDTALIVAARKGNMEVVTLLLDHGASLLHHNRNGRSASFEAAANAHPDIAAMLRLKESTLPMVYPVMDAVIRTIVNAVPVARMIFPPPQPPQTRQVDKAGNTVAHLLASHGHQPLLEDTADQMSEATNKKGMTPLCLAALNGHYKTVEMLLEQGAQVNHRSHDNVTPLWLACRLEECQPENGARSSTGSVLLNAEFMVNLMLRYGANPNQASFQQQTPLIAASANGDAGIVSCLLKAGAKVSDVDGDGYTPLMHASHFGHTGVARLLLDAGAAPDIAGQKIGALQLAAQRQHDSLVELLIERRADMDGSDANGRTALMAASAAGHLSTVKLLIKRGVYLKAVDYLGRKAIDYASEAGYSAVVRALQKGSPEPRDF